MWATLVVAIFVPTHHKNLHEMEEAQTKVLILGAGGVGAWAAKALKARGHEVVATTSSIDTTRALGCLGIEVLPWRWNGRGASWEALIDVNATKWMVTVPPRTGMDDAVDFHAELQAAAEKANVALLMWTSSTAVYDPQKEGVIEEEDAIHRQSRHTGVDLLQLEQMHVQGAVPFVAMRFGGLFSERRHPVSALTKRTPVNDADGHVQWVHEKDAALACVHALTHRGTLPVALNVVAPHVASRRALIETSLVPSQWPNMKPGGCQRTVSSKALEGLGFEWSVPSPERWVATVPSPAEHGCWEGPHGRLQWTRHRSRRETSRGRALMVHGYKGFKEWGNWKGVAERWAREGWDVWRMDFSHNGHVLPFLEDCVDTEAWSANRLHFEVNEVAFALGQIADPSLPLVVWGHSRGGAMAQLGALQHLKAGRRLDGIALWAPVSDLLARFPTGEAFNRYRTSGHFDVLNGRTGQILRHPWAFYEEAMAHKALLDLETASRQLSCPVCVVHGGQDGAVMEWEGRRLAEWSPNGSFHLVPDANHVFGMSHPWDDWQHWPEGLESAWRQTVEWLDNVK